jgi:hypothetical protein
MAFVTNEASFPPSEIMKSDMHGNFMRFFRE